MAPSQRLLPSPLARPLRPGDTMPASPSTVRTSRSRGRPVRSGTGRVAVLSLHALVLLSLPASPAWLRNSRIQASASTQPLDAVRLRPLRATTAGAVATTEVELPAEELVETEGELVKDLPDERLEALRRVFPTLNLSTPGIRLFHDDPPIFGIENALTEVECKAFVETMRERDGTFPNRLGQSDLPAVPGWLDPIKTALKGLPVVGWLGNPTVRWTYRSRNLLDDMREKVQNTWGVDLDYGQANIKHYRKDQWLPTHIDFNYATMMTYLNKVDEGGHTLFPTLGFKVRPKKGLAVFWPNQPPVKHAGDSVVEGEKWILFYNWPAEQNWEYSDNFDFNE